MDILSKEEIKKLIVTCSEYCISIYMPAHEQWNNMDEDKIRFKNQLQEIENSGKIYALHTDQMPAENPAAAVFRY